VAELLQAFKLKILVYDPFLSDADARRLGVERAGLADIFARCQVVSNHLADVPATKGLLTEELFQSLPKGATFLNTGRGATVDEAGLWKVLQRRRDLSAVLDVAEAEPPEASSPAYRLPNVFLTPHLAGSLGPETARMADWMLDEFEAYSSGRPVRFRLNLEQLATLA
jgi:phosphoglycerate dehydrogenase-like enzyme